jgi:hypothetical protein
MFEVRFKLIKFVCNFRISQKSYKIGDKLVVSLSAPSSANGWVTSRPKTNKIWGRPDSRPHGDLWKCPKNIVVYKHL